MSASIPGNGKVAEPGLRTVIPGSGVIRIIPVSVCYLVGTATTHRYVFDLKEEDTYWAARGVQKTLGLAGGP